MNQKYKFGMVFLAVGLLLGSFVTYSFSQGSSVFTLTSGIYPGAPAFCIYKEGYTYYAKNQYGSIAYSGTNATAIINTAIDAAPANSIVYFKSATYLLPATLLFDQDYLTYMGESRIGVRFETTGDFNAINITDAGHLEHITVKGFSVVGTGATNTHYGIYVYSAWHSLFTEIEISYFGYGMYLYGDATYSGGVNEFSFIFSHHNNYDGIRSFFHYDSLWSEITCYSNSWSGFYFAPSTQGTTLFRLTARDNLFNNLVLDGTRSSTILEADLSTSGQYGIYIGDSATGMLLDGCYVENAALDGVYITAGENPSFKYNTTGITINNSNFVKNNATGIKIVAQNGYNITDIKISNTNCLNNGRNTTTDFAGIFIGSDNDVGSVVNHIWINNIRCGNDYWEVGGSVADHQDFGITADYTSRVDYIQISMADTRDNLSKGIELLQASAGAPKTYCHVEFSYNLTTWIP